jgi:hypothetical protein
MSPFDSLAVRMRLIATYVPRHGDTGSEAACREKGEAHGLKQTFRLWGCFALLQLSLTKTAYIKLLNS